MLNQPPTTDEFITLITEHQKHLMGYIFASLGDYTNASDVLQQTNIVLWQKSHELRSSSEFLPWAFTVAKYKIFAFVRNRQRERLVFSPEVTAILAENAAEPARGLSKRILALQECLGQLPDSKLRLLKQRYSHNEALADIAAKMNVSMLSVKGRLQRIRKMLSQCIDQRLSY